MLSSGAAFVACLSLCFCVARGGVFDFSPSGTVIPTGERGLFKLSEHLHASSSASPALVHVDVTLARQGPLQNADQVDLYVIKSVSEQSSSVGAVDSESGELLLCCTEERQYLQVPGCTTPGKLILAPGATPAHTEALLFEADSAQTSLKKEFPVHEEGNYEVVFAKCSNEFTNVILKGSVAMKNSYGYLPIQLYAVVPISQTFLVLHVLSLVLFLGLLLNSRKSVTVLHYLLLGGIIVSIAAVASEAVNFSLYNTDGVENKISMYTMHSLNSLRHTSVRLLLVVLSTGIGLTSEWNGKLCSINTAQFLFLGTLFFVVKTAGLVISSTPGSTGGMTSLAFLGTALVLLDATFLLTIVRSLQKLTDNLQKDEQHFKLGTIVKLWIVCGTLASLKLAFIVARLVFNLSADKLSLSVELGLLEALYFTASCYMVFTYRPNSQSVAAFQEIPSVETEMSAIDDTGDDVHVDDHDEDLLSDEDMAKSVGLLKAPTVEQIA